MVQGRPARVAQSRQDPPAIPGLTQPGSLYQQQAGSHRVLAVVAATDRRTRNQDSHHTWHMEEPRAHRAEEIHTPGTKDTQDRVDSQAFVEGNPQVAAAVDMAHTPALVVDTQDMGDKAGLQGEIEAPLLYLKLTNLTRAHGR